MSAIQPRQHDYDVPGPDDAYVIRLEDSDEYRVKTTVLHSELVSYEGDVCDLIASKARALAYVLGTIRKENGPKSERVGKS